MSKAIDYFKGFLQIAFGLVFLTLILGAFSDIETAAQRLLQRASPPSSLEFAGFKVDFTPSAVALGLEMDNVPVDEQKPVLDKIHSLSSDAFVRLMSVGQLDNLCDYDRASAKMRTDIALDYGLSAEGLTTIESSPALLDSVRRQRAEMAARGEVLENGDPRDCYKMKLTALGANVKTVIVRNLAPAFKAISPAGNSLVAMK
ncbi:hypothetical protein [Methylocapsa aurea]|uniref:hypothetical protein n=1 Tax=Methylocapsa aurea TaxID=663610 RepID=UPI0012EC47EE|nr:hypothetical protein [Methylocapsa aurea]